MNKAQLSGFDSYFTYYPIDMAGTSPSDSPRRLPSFDAHRHGWVILTRISLTCILRHIVGLASRSDEHSHGWVILTHMSLMAGTCTIGLTSMASIHWWQSLRMREFTSYFAYILSNPSRTCIVGLASNAFMLLWTKSRFSDFDSYFTYYSTHMAGTCIIELTSTTSRYVEGFYLVLSIFYVIS